MVTYQELSDVRLGKLKAAAADWKRTAEKLDRLADGGDGGTSAAGLEKKAAAAAWKGHNAGVTKQFVKTTAREFGDAATAARSVHTVLDGAHTRLKKCKDDLADAVGRAARKNIYVNDKGQAIASVPPPHVTGGADVDEPAQAELDAVDSEIDSILSRAAEVDRTAAAALRFHAQEKYDFRSEGFSSFGGAKKSLEDSSEFVELASMDPVDMSNEQLARLNALARENGGDPVFAERVATGLGPRRTLEFFAGAVDLERLRYDGRAADEDLEKRRELLGDLEESLGTTLGTATRVDSEAMDAWKDQMVELGPQEVADDNGVGTVRVHGFQAMSNLMRHGTYEAGFLNDYGDSLVAFEKENIGDVQDPGPGGQLRENVLPWDKLPSYSKIDQLHFGAENDAGTDPMTGYLTALSHNPAASTDFFSSTEPQDNAEWVLEDRRPFNDVVPDSLGFNEGPEDYDGPKAVDEAAGAALVAGATGMVPGDTEAPGGPHTDGQREVLRSAVDHLGARGDDLPSEMRDDMAKIMVNHGDTVHDAMSSVDSTPPLDQEKLMEVSKQVSRDPETYAQLSEGMHHAILSDFQGERANPEDSLDRAGYSVGFMEEARQRAIGDQTAEELREAGWDEENLAAGVQTALGFIPHAGGPLSAGAGLIGTEWLENEEERISAGATEDHQDTYQVRQRYLDGLADEWYGINGDWAKHETGYSADRGVYSRIEASANDGNDKFRKLEGAPE